MSAQQGPLESLDRRGKLMGWEAVGRLDTGGGFCTGTLIARDVVLTAAHCVYDQQGRAIPAGQIRFRAGYHHGDAIADRRVIKWVVAEGYRDSGSPKADPGMIANDVALLRLDRDIVSSEADPFALNATPPEGTRVSVLSYGQGRTESLSREAECALTGRFRDGILTFDCDVTFGSSGAPVFVRDAGRLRILSVISALGQGPDGRKVAFGMTLPRQVQSLLARLRNDASQPLVTTGARRIGPGDRTSTGARFVRPGG